jgi:DNA repair protein RadC
MTIEQTKQNDFSRSEQLSFNDYHLKEVSVKLVLNESPGIYSSTPIRSAQDAVDALADVMRELDRERVCTIALNNKLVPVSVSTVSIGSTCSSVVPVANVFKTAILANASAVLSVSTHDDINPSVSYVMLAHNHP